MLRHSKNYKGQVIKLESMWGRNFELKPLYEAGSLTELKTLEKWDQKLCLLAQREKFPIYEQGKISALWKLKPQISIVLEPILPAWWGNTRQSWQMKTTVTEIKVSGTSRKTQHAKCMQFITAASWKPTKMTMKSQNRTDKDRRNENEAGNRQKPTMWKLPMPRPCFPLPVPPVSILNTAAPSPKEIVCISTPLVANVCATGS